MKNVDTIEGYDEIDFIEFVSNPFVIQKLLIASLEKDPDELLYKRVNREDGTYDLLISDDLYDMYVKHIEEKQNGL